METETMLLEGLALVALLFFYAIIRIVLIKKVVKDKATCAQCKNVMDEHERVHRTQLERYISVLFFNGKLKRYRCWGCRKKYYVRTPSPDSLG